MVLAWYTSMLPRMKKPPKLKDLMVGAATAPKAVRPDWRRQLKVARQWDAVTNRKERQNAR